MTQAVQASAAPQAAHLRPIDYYVASLSDMFLTLQDAGYTQTNRNELDYAAQILSLISMRFSGSKPDPYVVLPDINRCTLLMLICRQITALAAVADERDFNLVGALSELGTLGNADSTADPHGTGHLRPVDYSKYV